VVKRGHEFKFFAWLSEGFVVVFVIGYAIIQLFPSIVENLALVPGKIVPLCGIL
jgi:hypothetical protein